MYFDFLVQHYRWEGYLGPPLTVGLSGQKTFKTKQMCSYEWFFYKAKNVIPITIVCNNSLNLTGHILPLVIKRLEN